MLLDKFWVVALVTSALAKHGRDMGGRGGDDGGDDGGAENAGGDDSSSSASPTPTSSASSAANTTSSLTGTGDKICEPYLCITAVVNGSNVQYLLQSTGTAPVGWMAMGFGSQMANTPMVIMWENSDGSMTLSQRQAPAEVMPTLVSSPPRVATLAPELSSLSGDTPTYAYTIPANSDTGLQNIIWSFGTINPEDSSPDAFLQMHIDSGPTQINLAGTLSGNGSLTSDTAPVLNLPYQYYQKLIIAHATLVSLGFLILLPFGAILARYLRTYSPKWFIGHWIAQVGLAGPIILAGFILGIEAVKKSGAPQLNDTHKKWGVAIFVLYVFQCSLGTFVHFVKPRSARVQGKRPAQNYLHAILGLVIIGFAFYQVRSGFRTEWPLATGRGPVPSAVEDVWIVWVILLPLIYFLGLFFLRRQFAQERANRNKLRSVPPDSPSETQSLRSRNSTEMRRMEQR